MPKELSEVINRRRAGNAMAIFLLCVVLTVKDSTTSGLIIAFILERF
jgi:hypothetical protein